MRINKKNLIILVLFFISLVVLGLAGTKAELTSITNYYLIYLGFVVVGSLFCTKLISSRADIFEPIIIVSLIYIMFFSISPMLDILTNNTTFFGIDTSKGTGKATLIYVIGYISFLSGYSIIKSSRKKVINTIPHDIKISQSASNLNILFWSLGFTSSIIYLNNYGQSISYILTYGFLGDVANATQSGSLGFLSMFSYAMVVPWMYLLFSDRSTPFKIVISYLTGSVYFILGFRFIILIMAMAPFILKYLYTKKRPTITVLISVLVSAVIVIGLIGFARGDLRRGNEVNWSEFNLSHIWYGIESNFEIYKTFYRMVEVIPSVYPYTFGRQMGYTIPIVIPRFLWPTKPESPISEITVQVMGGYAADAGTAWPNIGEYYSEFGIFGVVVFMFVFGFLAKKSTKLYFREKQNIHTLIGYSVLLPTYIQIIIRGYTPTNFWMLVFFSFAVWINYKYEKNTIFEVI